MQELALVAIDEMGDELRRTLTDLRSRMREPLEASRATVDWSFSFALRHPDAAIAMVSEMNSASPTVRGHLRAMMQDLSSDIAANVRRFTGGNVATTPTDRTAMDADAQLQGRIPRRIGGSHQLLHL